MPKYTYMGLESDTITSSSHPGRERSLELQRGGASDSTDTLHPKPKFPKALKSEALNARPRGCEIWEFGV